MKLSLWGVLKQLEYGQIKEKEHELSDEKFDVKCCHKYLISFDLILDGVSWWSITGRAFQMHGAWKTIKQKFLLVLLDDLVCNNLLPDASQVGPVANLIKI